VTFLPASSISSALIFLLPFHHCLVIVQRSPNAFLPFSNHSWSCFTSRHFLALCTLMLVRVGFCLRFFPIFLLAIPFLLFLPVQNLFILVALSCSPFWQRVFSDCEHAFCFLHGPTGNPSLLSWFFFSEDWEDSLPPLNSPLEQLPLRFSLV